MRLHRWLPVLFVMSQGIAAESLPERIDAFIASKAAAEKQPVSAPATDAEFLRRVWLDFDGSIPSAEQARAFFADKSPDKRTKLIDQLIAGQRFAERMADAFDVMLMERRGDNADWHAWLVEAFTTNRPWDAMVRDMLAPDFKDAVQARAGWFMTRRLEKVGQQDTDYPGLTRDVGRMFMGIDLQCAQCHNHRTVDTYKQVDFNGLFTVYQNLKLQTKDSDHKTSWLSEGLMQAKYEFVSVLTEKKGQTGPRIPFGDEVMLPELKGDDAWLVKPDKKIKIGTPKFSPMRAIAEKLPVPGNQLFAKNIANRVWFLLMGRGLVHPLDLMHDDNPASHPELLDLLASELTAHKFDLRWFIRELALTQTYQRSSEKPEGVETVRDELFTTARQRHLTCDQQLSALLAAMSQQKFVEGITKADSKDDSKKYALADVKKAFAASLANPAKEPELDATPSLRSSLFFRNSDQVHWLLQARTGHLIERTSKLAGNSAALDELCLSILTRMPTDDERKAFDAWLARPNVTRTDAIGDFAWALVSSTEFFVNH